MTLKKCTVVELDPTFWRVDFDGELELAGAASTYSKWSGPFCIQVVPVRERLFTAFASGIGTSICGPTQRDAVDALLTHLGLARHDKPETAEDRVRAFLDKRRDETTLMDIGPEARGAIEGADLRAILAELDRVRAQRPVDAEKQRITAEYCRIATEVMEKAFDCQVAADCFCHESGNMPCFNHSDAVIGFVRDAVRAKIDGGAQPPVDVEAVLAPVREVARGIADAGVAQGRQLGAAWHEGRYADIPGHGAREHGYAWCASTIQSAIAEAEKIGRGQ